MPWNVWHGSYNASKVQSEGPVVEQVKQTVVAYPRFCGLWRPKPKGTQADIAASNVLRPAFQVCLPTCCMQCVHIAGGHISNSASRPWPTARGCLLSMPAHAQGATQVHAIARAVARLTSARQGTREAQLAWLEQVSATREPEHLTLQLSSQLRPIVEAARTRQVCLLCPPAYPAKACTALIVTAHSALLHARQPSLACTARHQQCRLHSCALPCSPPVHLWQTEDAPEVLARAVAALGKAPANVPLWLEAGAAEPLLELLGSSDRGLAIYAAQAVGALAREECPAPLSQLPERQLQVEPLSEACMCSDA